MIVTIDGPAGAGKSTVARALADRLGSRFLDTGAMYRVVALAALERGVPTDNPDALLRLARAIHIELDGDRVLLDGCDVTAAIRTSEVTAAVRCVADNAAVRQHLSELQRRFAEQGDVVTEGRDQGTLVFPLAGCKVFLTAADDERARRRWRELQQRGEQVQFDEVLGRQRTRDDQDRARPFGALRPADDAIVVETDGLTVGQVVDRLEQIVAGRSRPISE